ncbi:hypothetical protein BO71DRAFT_452914 [Aspergillus ellipticus CBS 707.79]|uniref:Uncharacterized protein n=1 Tax=Aspergillus ellipticus CBS 707.79 TaxID=1448320 RepID=A0A319D6Q6_9EURO|nr:hypothetical protein BO71DRAFT_452914 [Aspergillus ellipticus CBS 707.79]
MSLSIFLSQLFSPHPVIKLGRFVTNVDEPHRDYHDPPRTNYVSIDTLEGHHDIAHRLTAFLSSSISSQKQASLRITARKLKTCYVDNYKKCFTDAMQSDDVRGWLESMIKNGEDIYFVTGYHAGLDASIVEETDEQRNLLARLEMPVENALPVTGAAVPFGDAVNPQIAISRGHARGSQRGFVAQGRQIIAVQYCKLHFERFSRKTADNAMLTERTIWKTY